MLTCVTVMLMWCLTLRMILSNAFMWSWKVLWVIVEVETVLGLNQHISFWPVTDKQLQPADWIEILWQYDAIHHVTSGSTASMAVRGFQSL